MFLQFLFADRTLAFFCAEFHFGDQAAEVLVAGAGGDEEGKAKRIADCQSPIANFKFSALPATFNWRSTIGN